LIGFFGSFYSYEGLDLLIDAISLVRRKYNRVALVLLGSGPEDKALKSQVARLGLGADVAFIGRVAHEQIAAFYQHMDLFVFPRRKMRLTDIVTPLKPLEAMAAGALVLASDVGGHRELIDDGRTGILYRSGELCALINGISNVIDHPADFDAVRSAGHDFVHRERTWPRVARAYVDVYKHLSNSL
jgi:glycosyltransferase involved in cell wall biosynthesis